MTVDRCSVAWTDPQDRPHLPRGLRADRQGQRPPTTTRPRAPTFTLQPLTAGSPEHLLVTLAVEDSAAAMADDSLMGLTGSMGVGLTATAIDDRPITPATPGRGNLANTGVDGGLQAMLAFGALTAGLLGLAMVAGRLHRRTIHAVRTTEMRRLTTTIGLLTATVLTVALMPSTIAATTASWPDDEWVHDTVGTSSFDCGTDEGYATTASGRFLSGSLLGTNLDNVAALRGMTVTRDGAGALTVDPSNAQNLGSAPPDATYATRWTSRCSAASRGSTSPACRSGCRSARSAP